MGRNDRAFSAKMKDHLDAAIADKAVGPIYTKRVVPGGIVAD
jgi:hypothetical protein